MALTRRERKRLATGDEIKAVARRQMAERGAGELSLRAIAGEMGMTAPAIYRYFGSRDDLVTALIVDAYRALGRAIDDAQAGVDEADYPARFVAMAIAYRGWALAHPAEFALIFGTPIPGYHAPEEVTVPVVLEAFAPFVTVPEAAWRAGRLDPSGVASGDAAETDARLGAWLDAEGVSLPAHLVRHVLEGWSLMHGMVTLEQVGHLPPLLGDCTELYESAIRAFVRRLGLRSTD